MDKEQGLRPDLQQRLVDALYGTGTRRSDSIEELADALIAVAEFALSRRSSSDEQAAGGVTEERAEAACRDLNPRLFGDNPTVRHIEASPLTVEAAQSSVRTMMRSALTAALAVRDEGMREAVPIKYVTLGRGEWVAGAYMRDDMPSLCFGPAPEPKAPGEKPTDEVSEWATRNGAVVISFANLNAAVQMLDLVRDAIDLKTIPLPTPIILKGEGV